MDASAALGQSSKNDRAAALRIYSIWPRGTTLPILNQRPEPFAWSEDSHLNDADLKSISQIPYLHVLDLRFNPITDSGFKELAKMDTLTDVRLSETRLTPRCIETIKKMPHLTNISMSINSWSQKEQADFIDALNKVHCHLKQ